MKKILDKDLTFKQKAFVKEKLTNPGISDRQAALNAGYSVNTADNARPNILEHRGIEAFIDKLADDDKIAQVLNDGLTAQKTDITGDTHPDHRTRLEFAKELLGLKGYRKQGLEDVTNVKRKVTFEEFFGGNQ